MSIQGIESVEKIVEYVQELLTTAPNGKYQLARIFGMAQREEDLAEKEKKFVQMLSLSNRERVVETVIIQENMAIVEIKANWNGQKETYFRPAVKGRRSTEVHATFDRALFYALGLKYGVESIATEALVNILKVDEYEKRMKEALKQKTFMDKLVAGEATIDQIDDAIDEWHDSKEDMGSIYEYLGLTEAEYGLFVQNTKNLEIIVESVKSRFKVI